MSRPLVLLSDFGRDDPYAGVVEAAMASIAPAARCIHLTHAVPPQDVRAGSFALAYALPWLPPEAVVWAVVDPGVGTDRRPVAVDGRVRRGGPGQRVTLVAPDNGLLTEALARMDVWAAVVLDEPRYHGPASSTTFHGRDVFGPAAAWLAHGEPFTSLGAATDPAGLIRLELPVPLRVNGAWRGTVRWVDHFGNVVTDLPADLVAQGAWVVTVHPERPDGRAEASGTLPSTARRDDGTGGVPLGRTFASVEPGSAVAYVGSWGTVEIAVRDGSAAVRFGAGSGARVELRTAAG